MSAFYLTFGVPSIDGLICTPNDLEPSRGVKIEEVTVSVCLSGPAGTGKSLLALHIVSQYARQLQSNDEARVIYASTDLSHKQALNAWKSFDLGHPAKRQVPFTEGYQVPPASGEELDVKIELDQYDYDPGRLAAYIQGLKRDQDQGDTCDQICERQNCVGFIDLQRSTAGDDWGFLNRLVASLPARETKEAKHLLVIDAVEGLETLAGNLDSFGVSRTRRSRVAQILRTAGQKCHIVFVVEDLRLVEREIEENPEEYVTDIVLRLSNMMLGQYRRRMIEAVKVRFGSHQRGEHQILIRSGVGSTTGEQKNSDDPEIPHGHPEDLKEAEQAEATHAKTVQTNHDDPSETSNAYQSYIHVVHSLHAVNRQIMRARIGNRLDVPKDRFAEFGIPYLDNMLAELETKGGESREDKEKRKQSYWTSGLPCSTLTAIIGDEGTNKSRLGHAFIARAFAPLADELWKLLCECESPWWPHIDDFAGFFNRPGAGPVCAEAIWTALSNEKYDRAKFSHLGLVLSNYFESTWDEASPLAKDKDAVIDKKYLPTVLSYVRYRIVSPHKFGQAAVYLCTHDIHRRILADKCVDKLTFDCKVDAHLEAADHAAKVVAFKAALRVLIEHYTVCRRLEIHDLPSALLCHLIECGVRTAQQRLIPSDWDPNKDRLLDSDGDRKKYTEIEARYLISSRIRLVIDDFRLIRDTYPDVRQDPLLLPYLRFFLGREGITALLVDSHPGRPDVSLNDRFDSELRTIVDHRLYTWRMPFLGYSRVAIAAVPPIGQLNSVLVRELTSKSDVHGNPVIVDPKLELWDGLLEGAPKRVGLQIKLAGQTPAGRAYADRINSFFSDLFPPLEANGRIVPSEPPSYETLRALCYLQTDVQLNHSLIFTVDEFWGGDRVTGLADCSAYLEANTLNDPENLADPHDVYVERWNSAEPKKQCKHEYFTWPGAVPGTSPGTTWPDQTDRVPYTWDFGFMLTQELAWRESGRRSLPILKSTLNKMMTAKHRELPPDLARILDNITVEHVAEVLRYAGQPNDTGPPQLDRPMNAMTVGCFVNPLDDRGFKCLSWRVILEACAVVAAHSPVAPNARKIYAFDVDMTAPETFSCLVLEMWMSEVLLHNPSCDTSHWLERQTKREYCNPKKRNPEKPPPSINSLLEMHGEELFGVCMLLAEVFEEGQFAGSDSGFEFVPRECHPYSVATRHWYSTACHAIDRSHESDRLMAVRLPGQFSVRGDWFLATAKGSRSRRLTDEALDLLSSGRANFDRMQCGVGLPTREILPHPPNNISDGVSIRTALAVGRKSSRDPGLTYEGLKRLGVNPKPDGVFEPKFDWLWRSEINHYDRDRGLWLKWIWRTINWLLEVKREYGASWTNGFEVYDQMWFVSDWPPRRDVAQPQQVQTAFKQHVDLLRSLLPIDSTVR